jgi:TRAP-type C4-dicarboxylate transport system permease small subunit
MTSRIDRVIDVAEVVAAMFLAAITAITFVSVALRYVFAWSIPDAYDLSRNLLGIVIFWGIAAASWRGEHITVDLVWGIAPAGAKRAMDVFAGLLSLACLAVFAWMFTDKVISTFADNVRTYDLRLPVWVFYGIAWAGVAAAALLLAIRAWRLVTGTALPPPSHTTAE